MGMGEGLGGWVVPGRAVLKHGVEDYQQLAHTGGESQLFRLAGRQQALVEVPYDRVETAGCHRPHIEGCADLGPSTPPAGEFASVSAGHYHNCGVQRDGSVACWGRNTDPDGNVVGNATPPAGEFVSVSAGGQHACGVQRDDSVACWGSDRYGQATPLTGEFASVSATYHHNCAVQRGGAVECWESWGGNNDYDGNEFGQATPPAGEFASVSAGGEHTCGVQRDSSVACWGRNTDNDGNVVGQATPPVGEFASVSAGNYFTCGVKLDGSVDAGVLLARPRRRPGSSSPSAPDTTTSAG